MSVDIASRSPLELLNKWILIIQQSVRDKVYQVAINNPVIASFQLGYNWFFKYIYKMVGIHSATRDPILLSPTSAPLK